MKSRKSVRDPIDHDDFPDIELEYFFDNSELPATVTITNAESAGTLATEWITTEIDDAVPFESIP